VWDRVGKLSAEVLAAEEALWTSLAGEAGRT
jgi:hypothetical protein